MSLDYLAPNAAELAHHWNVSSSGDWKPDVGPGDSAPIIRRRGVGPAGPREVVMARFGLLPASSKTERAAGSSINMRAEVAATRPASQLAYSERQWCIVPASRFHVPFFAEGSEQAERWSVQRTDGTPLSIAGIWDHWVGGDGREVTSFAMLTINCDLHPLLQRFGASPAGEMPGPHGTRTPVLLADEDFDAWLDTPPGRAPYFFGTFGADEIGASLVAPSLRQAAPAMSCDSTISGF